MKQEKEDKEKVTLITQDQLTNYKLDLILTKLEEIKKLANGND